MTKIQSFSLSFAIIVALCIIISVAAKSSSLVSAHGNHADDDNHDREPPEPELPGKKKSSSPYDTPHHCIHDTHVVPQMQREDAEFAAKGLSRPEARIAHPDGREAEVLAIGNMRFVIRTPDLYDTTKYCTAASGSVKNMQNTGTTIACSTTDDILTTEKRDLLVNTLIPAAVEQLAYAYSVTQTTGNIMLPSTTICGADWMIPSADLSRGVANADYVLYVAASPIAGSVIAFAGPCAVYRGRPVVGRMNFQPKYILWNTSHPKLIEYVRRATMHELSHALGFSSSLFLSSPVSGTRRGKPIKEKQTAKTVAAVRALTGCSTITGAEIEDQGGALTVGSHLEARIFKDSLMTGIIGESRMDSIVLSIFDDSGLYTVNYSVQEFMVWGNNSYTNLGCGFTDQRCGLAAAGLGDWCGDYPCPFCNSETNQLMISQDRRWSGYCTYMADLGIGTLPAAYQNFATTTAGGVLYDLDLADYTSYVSQYFSRVCDDITVIPDSNDVIYGWTFATNSRALSTIGLIQNGYVAPSRESRCVELRCKTTNAGASWFLQFRVQYDTWISCNTDGTFGPITVTGAYTGTVECPKATTICNANYPSMYLYDFTTTTTATTTTTTTTTTTNPPSYPVDTSQTGGRSLDPPLRFLRRFLSIGALLFILVYVGMLLWTYRKQLQSQVRTAAASDDELNNTSLFNGISTSATATTANPNSVGTGIPNSESDGENGRMKSLDLLREARASLTYC